MVLKEVPCFLRRHESLVIKASRNQTCKPGVHAAQVKFDAGFGVNRAGSQAVDQADFGHARIGNGARTVEKLHQRVRLFDPGGQNAARTMVLPATSHQLDTVGKQGGSQRVTRQTLITATVEGELQRLLPINPSTLGQALACVGAHVFSLFVRAAGACSPIFHTASKR